MRSDRLLSLLALLAQTLLMARAQLTLGTSVAAAAVGAAALGGVGLLALGAVSISTTTLTPTGTHTCTRTQ